MPADPPPDNQITTELSRELSLFHLTMMGIGMMIGAGVFLGVGNAVRVAGPGGVLLTFALNGMVATFTAMSYAELSSAIPRAGGAYNFARIAFGRGTSFLAGWMEWFASSVAGSIYALTFAIYSLHFLGQLGLLAWLPLPLWAAEKLLAVLVALFFIYINYRGASETGKTGAFFALGQTVTLAFIGLVGVGVVLKDPSRLANFQPFLPNGWSRLLVTMGFTYVAFEGFEVIAQAGDEALDPRRNLPKAMLYSIFVAGSTYLLVALAAVVGVKAESPGVEGPVWQWIGSFGERGFAHAIARLMPLGGLLVTLAVIFASTSALNATIYSATRASYALGRDCMMPRALARISARQKTPYVALAATAVIVLSIAAFLPTMDVASSASIMFLFLFFLVNICVVRIRLNMGDELTYGFVMPLFPVLPVVAVLFQAALAAWLAQMSWLAWVVGPSWVLAGVMIYHTYSKQHAISTADEIVVLEEEPTPEQAAYRVMVPVANPNNAVELARNAFRLCEAKDAQVHLLHMVPVPEQVPLSDARDYILTGREAITEAMIYLVAHHPVTTTIRYCRNVARGIVAAAREKRIDMIIMGWRGTTFRREFIFGSTLDPVIEKAPCNVVVFKNCAAQTFRRILVPFAGGPNSALALEVASILVDPEDGQIVPFHVSQPGKPWLDIEPLIQEAARQRQVRRELLKPKQTTSSHIIRAILDESRDYDLVAIGASRERLLQQMVTKSIPEEVAVRCDKPLVMVKSTEGVESLIKRWI